MSLHTVGPLYDSSGGLPSGRKNGPGLHFPSSPTENARGRRLAPTMGAPIRLRPDAPIVVVSRVVVVLARARGVIIARILTVVVDRSVGRVGRARRSRASASRARRRRLESTERAHRGTDVARVNISSALTSDPRA
jgi:hypothetical protein